MLIESVEDAHKGNLTVTLDYIKLAQDVKTAIHFLQKIGDQLDMAAIEKGMVQRERRMKDSCRRKNNECKSS